MRRLLLLTVLSACLVGPGGGAAQSLLGAGGLGIPVEPLDARARALGSVGVGLFGSSLLPADPAAVLSVQLPLVSVSMQPTSGTVSRNGQESDLSTTRFPLIGVAYPVGTRAMATVTFGGFLDQRWSTSVDRTVDLAGEDVAVTDAFISDGGISALRVGVAARVGTRLGVAVSGGVYTGELTRRFIRQYDTIAVGPDVSDFVTQGRWRYSGPTLTAGAVFDPINLVRVSGSVTWSGQLDADPQDGTTGGGRSFDLPLEYRVGASGGLTPRLSATFGFSFADWTDTGRDLATGGEARAVWSLGGGLEWDGFRFLGREFPVRLGYRRTELPFQLLAADPTETTYGGGLGLNLAQVEGIPLARIDASIERGDRSAGSVSEQFWRATVSLRVSGR